MYFFFDSAAAAFLMLFPFLFLNRNVFHSWKRTLLCFVFAVYLTGVYAVAGLPNVLYIRMDVNLNLIPFRDLHYDLMGAVLNVILFIPLGFFLPLLWNRFQNAGQTLLFGFLMSMVIELSQLFTFRATDVNDLMTNTLGTLLGWVPGLWAARHFPSLCGYYAKRELTAVFGWTLLVMFFIHPFLMNMIWSMIL